MSTFDDTPFDGSKPGDLRKNVRPRELEEVYTIHSPFVDKVYITVKPDNVRLSFCEELPGDSDMNKVRQSVTFGVQGFMQFAQMMMQTAMSMQQTIQAAQQAAQEQQEGHPMDGLIKHRVNN